MARTFESKMTSDSGTDTDEEIWKTIRYLDPDGGLRKGDIVLGVIWTLVFVLLGLFIFLMNRCEDFEFADCWRNIWDLHEDFALGTEWCA